MWTILTLILFCLICICILLLCFHSCHSCQNQTQIHEQFTENSKITKWKKRVRELKKVNRYYLSYFNIPHEQIKPKEILKNKIFISIASYRDYQCHKTLYNLIEQADHPEDLHIYICQQNSIFDKDCMISEKLLKNAKVFIERLNYFQAKGPNWARYRIQQKWSGEEFILQIDSHSRLCKSWDTILKTQLGMLPEKSVLSQYPNELKIEHNQEKSNEKLRGSMYVKSFGEDGFIRFQSNYSEGQRHPFRSIGWVAGFSFSKYNFILDVPIDPYLYLFFGEQADIALRAYTKGYQFYCPSIVIVYHIYDRKYRNTYWELLHQKPLEILSRFRLYYKLGMIKLHHIPKQYRSILRNIDHYSLGHEKTIEEFGKEANVNVFEENLILH